MRQQTDEKKSFKASYGWLRRFFERKNLAIRRVSGSGRGIPSNYHNIIIEYLRKIEKSIKDFKFKPNEIFNFDESSFYMCSPGNYTVDLKDKKKPWSKVMEKKGLDFLV